MQTCNIFTARSDSLPSYNRNVKDPYLTVGTLGLIPSS